MSISVCVHFLLGTGWFKEWTCGHSWLKEETWDGYSIITTTCQGLGCEERDPYLWHWKRHIYKRSEKGKMNNCLLLVFLQRGCSRNVGLRFTFKNPKSKKGKILGAQSLYLVLFELQLSEYIFCHPLHVHLRKKSSYIIIIFKYIIIYNYSGCFRHWKLCG